MKYNGVIQRKLSLLDEQVGNIRHHLAGVPFEEFKDSWPLRSMSERALQVAVEIIIDIAERIIALEKAGPVPTAADAIDRLAELGILSSAERYKPIVKFRNLIVHEYEQIDAQIVYEIITEKLDDFYAFRDEIDLQ